MGEPARLNDDDRMPKNEGQAPERPDWLVTPDEGARSESTRQAQPHPPSAEPIRLLRPEDHAEELSIESASVPPPALVRRPPPRAANTPPAPAKPTAWAAAAPSVPTLKLENVAESSTRAAPAIPPADGAEDDPSASASLSSFEDEPAAPAGPPVPRARPLEEPWWVVALDALRSERRLQLLVLGLVVAIVAAFVLWPRSGSGVSLSTLRRDPAKWDSQRVRVHGRVGDVFPLGGGYAFYLLQGRDTIVVFTRSREPVRDKSTDVVGSVSTGFLDGVARQSIFEEP